MKRKRKAARAAAIPVVDEAVKQPGSGRRGPPCIPATGNTFGANLRRARESAGLTMTEAARRCGVEYKRWASWERGPREPFDAAIVADVLGALGCEITDLIPE